MSRRSALPWLVALWACSGSPPSVHPPADRGARCVGELAAATRRLLATLQPEQLARAQRPLDDPEVESWHFVPGRYAGIELGGLDRSQQPLVDDVLHALLSAGGFAKTMAIRQLEEVLRERESAAGRDASHRDPDRYALLVCGEPGERSTFVVRFQGHHVSLRVAVVDGLLAGFTPHFLGTNPHRLAGPAMEPSDAAPNLEAEQSLYLHAEEDMARRLLASLDDAQRARATIAADAPPDVLLGPGREPTRLGERSGLPLREMSDAQQRLLWRLLEVYAQRFCAGIEAAELERIRREDLDVLTFAWAGSYSPGQGHYYRLHGRHFAIEYDNTQDGANHVHTVWRDFDRDFGGDPLREHLRREHDR